MAITEAQALTIVSLDSMKTELRIPLSEVEHDALIIGQILAAASFVSRSTGRTGGDLMPLRAAVVAAARAQYDGEPDISRSPAHDAWLAPFRSYK